MFSRALLAMRVSTALMVAGAALIALGMVGRVSAAPTQPSPDGGGYVRSEQYTTDDGFGLVVYEIERPNAPNVTCVRGTTIAFNGCFLSKN